MNYDAIHYLICILIGREPNDRFQSDQNGQDNIVPINYKSFPSNYRQVMLMMTRSMHISRVQPIMKSEWAI
jgi:hypothetical protein